MSLSEIESNLASSAPAIAVISKSENGKTPEATPLDEGGNEGRSIDDLAEKPKVASSLSKDDKDETKVKDEPVSEDKYDEMLKTLDGKDKEVEVKAVEEKDDEDLNKYSEQFNAIKRVKASLNTKERQLTEKDAIIQQQETHIQQQKEQLTRAAEEINEFGRLAKENPWELIKGFAKYAGKDPDDFITEALLKLSNEGHVFEDSGKQKQSKVLDPDQLRADLKAELMEEFKQRELSQLEKQKEAQTQAQLQFASNWRMAAVKSVSEDKHPALFAEYGEASNGADLVAQAAHELADVWANTKGELLHPEDAIEILERKARKKIQNMSMRLNGKKPSAPTLTNRMAGERSSNAVSDDDTERPVGSNIKDAAKWLKEYS